MNIQLFVCFHKKIFSDCYKISQEEKEKYLTFYGVDNEDLEINKNVIYEYDLIDYNPILQKKSIMKEVVYITFIKIVYIIMIISDFVSMI